MLPLQLRSSRYVLLAKDPHAKWGYTERRTHLPGYAKRSTWSSFPKRPPWITISFSRILYHMKKDQILIHVVFSLHINDQIWCNKCSLRQHIHLQKTNQRTSWSINRKHGGHSIPSIRTSHIVSTIILSTSQVVRRRVILVASVHRVSADQERSYCYKG